MRKIRRQVLISAFMLGLCLLTMGPLVAADDPTVTTIFAPENPTPLSAINFTTTVVGDNITEVRLIVAECTDQVCLPEDNLSMSLSGTDEYQATVTLTHDDAVKVQYHIDILKNDGTWYHTEITEFNLTISSNGDNGGTNGGTNGTQTPGFELVLFLGAVAIMFFIYTRKE